MKNPTYLKFHLLLITLVLCMSGTTWAGTAYVANEGSATVSVIDTATNFIVATIGLGSDPAIAGTPQPNGPYNGEADHHKAFYNGHADTHGLWLTPDGATLLVTNRLSGTVVAIDTATNTVLGYTPVGREPHLATVRPGGSEAWVAVRGENYIDVLKLDHDLLRKSTLRRTGRMPVVATVDTMNGPSMVSFTSDGRHAFVVSGKQNRVDKFDATERKLLASQTLPANFTPFGMVTPDNEEIYLVHKGAGTLSFLSTDDLDFIVRGMHRGARANHVFFVGRLAYITVGGATPSASNPDPLGKVVVLDRKTRTVVREFTGPDFSGEPHGIWATGDGKLYVGHEGGNRVTIIAIGNPDNATDDLLVGIVGGTPDQLAFLKKPIDIVVKP